MFGFPIGNGNAGFNDFVEKFTNNADSGFPKIQQREVFYSIKDGNWNDTTIWQTASGRIGNFPTSNDDVYIRHSVFNNAANVVVNNLFVTGVLSMGYTGQSMSVLGNMKCTGTFNQITGGISLYGSDNYINNYIFTNGSEATISYARNDGIPQPIMPLTYWYISMNGISKKYLTTDLITTGTSGNVYNYITSPLDTNGYNMTINSPIQWINAGNFIANGSTLVFKGAVTWTSITRYEIINSTLEFQNGWAWSPPIGTFANSVINFTTNTQNVGVSFSGAGAHIIDANSVNIVGNIELNISASSTDYFVLNCPINGTNASSKLTNRGFLQFGNTTSIPSMTTGIWDFTTYANTINYGGNYSATIPSYFTNFHNLTISGTGTKTLGVNTTLNGNLNTQGIFDLSSYNFTVNGTTTIGTNQRPLLKTGPGSVLFVGLISSGGGGQTIDFSGGNPSVECRGGFDIAGSTQNFNSGTGTWTFTTNNQTAGFRYSIGIFYGDVIISGNISVTIGIVGAQFNTKVDGTVAGSTLLNGSTIYLASTTLPMSTAGVYNPATSGLTGYVMNTTYTLPNTTYYALLIGGTGTKTVSGNTTITTTLQLNTSLELSIYNLTVNGTTTLNSVNLSKTGAGNVTFVGNVTSGGGGGSFSFSGNPDVEFRGGLALNPTATLNTGTGTWTFSTNNQTVSMSSTVSPTLNCNILISGAITLTYFTNINIIHLGIFNGNNASSTLRISANASITYRNATQPMATGILDTSTNLNTFIYGLNNQDIKGGPTTLAKQVYRNLTLNGTGVKTLQGYVSVQNTYTLTAPATLALNGFTLTNP